MGLLQRTCLSLFPKIKSNFNKTDAMESLQFKTIHIKTKPANFKSAGLIYYVMKKNVFVIIAACLQ